MEFIYFRFFDYAMFNFTLTPMILDSNDTALYAASIKKKLNQTLDFKYTVYHHIQQKNQFHQFQLTYDITDTIQIKIGYIFLRPSFQKKPGFIMFLGNCILVLCLIEHQYQQHPYGIEQDDCENCNITFHIPPGNIMLV